MTDHFKNIGTIALLLAGLGVSVTTCNMRWDMCRDSGYSRTACVFLVGK